ncbi:hypothetical protein FE772_10780 [Lysobacter enzymogenes]|nr:hypothetical protein [Lysobacter enzymogenes]QCW26081.1 hypothetical protein FE772_10780 [Lysobacter enzymogenes]
MPVDLQVAVDDHVVGIPVHARLAAPVAGELEAAAIDALLLFAGELAVGVFDAAGDLEFGFDGGGGEHFVGGGVGHP